MRKLATGVLRRAQAALRRRGVPHRYPVITSPWPDTDGATRTAAIICGNYFDERIPNAGVTYRRGLRAGFEACGIPCAFVSVRELGRLDDLSNPVVMLSEFDYELLTDDDISRLRKLSHFVWVTPWFPDWEAVFDKHRYLNLTPQPRYQTRVFESEPSFVFAPVPPSALEYYSSWAAGGLRMVSLPQACDTSIYHPKPGAEKFANVRLAFVGGYWEYKARQFDLYLKPFEQDLTVFGYSAWPYAGYGGQLSVEDEPLLYRGALLSPAISEPHAEKTGDIVERVYKVMGSGGLCIAEVVAGYRELFRPDELLMPSNVEEYCEMVRAVLRDPDMFAAYRERGLDAIAERHTYVHRVHAMLELLG